MRFCALAARLAGPIRSAYALSRIRRRVASPFPALLLVAGCQSKHADSEDVAPPAEPVKKNLKIVYFSEPQFIGCGVKPLSLDMGM